MLVKRKPVWDLPASEVTPEATYRSRRDFMKVAGAGAVGALAGATWAGEPPLGAQTPLKGTPNPKYVLPDPLNTFEQFSTYNNFYEFGVEKYDPSRNAGRLKTKPWSVKIDGHVAKPGTYAFDDLVKPQALQERVYRFRCVERWAAIVPWIGIPLADVLARVEPTSRAKYVAFETLHRPSEMPGQLTGSLEWPYVEGLRLDEARHDLAFLAVGMFGRVLPNQNGAPLRLVVPWKYGFKNIKSIVRISLTDTEPPTSWNIANAREYGFYSNVNPDVDHPRWSQKRERRLGEVLMNRPTVLFNGYGEQVAGLYAGMDLRKFY